MDGKKCMICGSIDPVSFLEKKGFRITRCSGCGLLSVDNIPPDIEKYYSGGYFTGDVSLEGYMDYDADKEAAGKSYLKYADFIKRYTGKPDPEIFEIGCATGYFMQLAGKEGMKADGMDISEYAVGKAREKGLEAVCGKISGIKAGKKYDAVVMLDVIEHLENPLSDFKIISDMIKPGGILMVLTPDSRSLWARVMGKKWHAFVPPQHLNLFSRDNIGSFLEKSEMKTVYLGHFGKNFTIPYILRLLHTWTGAGFFGRLAQWSSGSIFKNINIPINLGDTMLVIAKKYEL